MYMIAMASYELAILLPFVLLLGFSILAHARLGQSQIPQVNSANVMVWEPSPPKQDASLKSCLCSNNSCGCCQHLDVPTIRLNAMGCANITYLPEDYGITVVMTVDQYVLFNDTISAKNPPPICTVAPYFEKYAQLCLKFHDLALKGYDLHACLAFEAYLMHIVQKTYELGCFDV